VKFGDILLSALRGVTANKLRSILTMLGVLIGVGAVILLMAVGNGSAQRVNSLIDSLGTNTLTIRSNGQSSGSQAITLAVSKELSDAGLGHVKTVVPESTTELTVSSTSTSEEDVSIVGTTPGYFSVSAVTVASGASFTNAEVTDADKVAVIGSTLATDLYPTGSALGQSINVDGTPFTVVGILATQSSTGFTDPNLEVVAPVTRIQRSYTGFGALSEVLAESKTSAGVTAAEGELGVELNQLLQVSASDAAASSSSTTSTGTTSTTTTGRGRFAAASSATSSSDLPYTITNASTLLATAEASATSFTVLLAAVAAISLLVGGIGVTNVMLVTVTERTREIGIRKAIGATRGAILGQFLAEAAILTLLGGILGVIAAVFLSQFEIDGTQPVIIGYSIPLALGVSVAIGVFFGVYPAGRAAAMRPIQALRSI